MEQSHNIPILYQSAVGGKFLVDGSAAEKILKSALHQLVARIDKQVSRNRQDITDLSERMQYVEKRSRR